MAADMAIALPGRPIQNGSLLPRDWTTPIPPFSCTIWKRKATQVTSGFYQDSGPVFSIDGKYLFYLSDRGMNAAYSDMNDGTWIYPNSTQIAAMALNKKGPSSYWVPKTMP